VNGFRTFLASIRFSGNRFDLYYRNVVGRGAGYPTADEARRDVSARDRQLHVAGVSYLR
jgi:hypothetical protein